MKIDLKSALLGLLIGIGTMLSIGAGESSREVGRYQIAGGVAVFVVVDTATGKTWYCNLGRPGYMGETGGFWEKKLDK